MRIWINAALLFLALTTPAHAYIGPGAGLGALFTLLAIVVGGILLVVGFLWYPIKRALRKRKTSETKGEEADLPR